MSKNIVDTKTLAIVLRRTNYGEADRILNLITPDGKVSAMARGVRKAKSKLAGGVEMFSLVELNLHFGKSELATVTGARMVKYYGAILADYNRMELASMMLRKINTVAEGTNAAEYFEIARECLDGLNSGMSLALVESWFLFNLLKVSGEEVNLYRDGLGDKLREDAKYYYDANEMAFMPKMGGEFGVDEIKLMRLMVSAKLQIVSKVKNVDEMAPGILRLARVASKMI